MSKCKRPKLPAFDLNTVHQATQETQEDTPHCAAKAEIMSEILPHIMLGSWRDAEDEAAVKKAGITHILNVAKECPSAAEQASMDAIHDVNQKKLELIDAHSEDILPHFENAFAFIEEARLSGGKILVHCRRGISRSPAIVTGYIMCKTQCSYEAALAYVKERRASVSLNLAFRTVLEDYQPANPNPDSDLEKLVCCTNCRTNDASSNSEAGMTQEGYSDSSCSAPATETSKTANSPDYAMCKTESSFLAEDEEGS